MVSSRQAQPEKEGNGRGFQIPVRGETQRRNGGSNESEIISTIRNLIKGSWMNDIGSYLEPLIRKTVREEVERMILGYQFPRARFNQSETSGAKPLQLRFINKLPETLFTLSKIKAEDHTPLQIALFDVRSQSIVNDGPLSSIKVEMCVLNGEFGSDGSEDWNEEEYGANVLKERDGKRPLLNGDKIITLKNGVGCITNLMFTDNSSWIRSRKFRLGVNVVGEENIRGGRSESFVVKDCRGEVYKKHHPPSLNDDIWRLERIAKDGKIHKRLSLNGICTVKDLLQLYMTNPTSLYEKLGNISKKSWVAITEHAKACVIDDYNLYVYHTAEQPIGLLFDSVYMLVGVTFDGQNYCSPDTLTPNEKLLVERVKQHAYKNVKNLKSVDNTSFGLLSSVACLPSQSVAPDPALQQLDFPTANQGFSQPFTSTSYVSAAVYNNQVDADPISELGELSQNSSAGGELLSAMYDEGNNWPFIGSQKPFVTESYFSVADISPNHFANYFSPATSWGPGHEFYYGSCDGAQFSIYSSFPSSSTGKPKAAWYKIRTALKWVISVRKDAAAKRMAKLFNYNS